MAKFTCDEITTEIPNEVLPIVKGWVEKRDGEIKDLKSQLQGSVRSISLDGKSYSIPGQEEELEDAMEEKSDRQDAEIERLTGEVDGLKAELTKKTDSKALAEAVKLRRELENKSACHLDSGFNFDQHSDREIKELVVRSKMDGVDEEKFKSDAYLDGMFSAVISLPVSHVDSSRSMLKSLVSNKTEKKSIQEKKDAQEEKLKNRWRETVGGN